MERWKTAIFALGTVAAIVIFTISVVRAAKEKTEQTEQTAMPSHHRLTPEEERVIVYKGTEAPFSGALLANHETGVYHCKRCGAALFSSAAKFNSGTGWPSFDEALPGAVKQIPDADGSRVEIVCAACGAHLGHVFFGENFTPKEARFCVNSVSLDFARGAPTGAGAVVAVQAAKAEAAGPALTAYFAGGCFWGVEYYLRQQPGVIAAEVGYMGGTMDSPSYRDVSGGRTGHAETVMVTYDPTRVSYEQLAKLFFEIHDPTEVNRQGPDVGTQYRSIVFYSNDEQKAVAEKLIGQLRAKGFKVVTQVVPAGHFWKAEDYHQDYYFKNGETPYCHFRVKRFD
jgi:peptide methionine sulfoxide reductase msrA/msrB